MSLHLFDTLAGDKVPFVVSEPGTARIYVCGPTTYDDAHIGHARPCIVYDVLVRHLRTSGLEVTYVRNVTDIDDKIIKRAAERGEEPAALSQRMFESYDRDMRRLNNLPPDHQPKVSEHMSEIIALIEKLIARGHAYPSAGDVYFSVSSFSEYGKLSHRDLTQLEAGRSQRVDEEESRRKQHPYDFALWKGAKQDEISWPSPWGPGRPGWHIECSAMSMKYLGESFDLHGGGLDLVFPHHENEIAQSECATGKCFSRHWMHNGFVQVNSEKMSKSLGNFFRLAEAFERTEPEAIRYALLSVHYRSPFNLEMDLDPAGHLLGFPQFREAEGRLSYLYRTILRLADIPEKKVKGDARAPAEISEFGARLKKALDDDLNTAQGIAHLSALLKAVNELVDLAIGKSGSVSAAALEQARQALIRGAEVLGLGQDEPVAFLQRVRARGAKFRGIEESWVAGKIQERASARQAKDYARADEVRQELAARGVELLDTPLGTDWRLSEST